MRNLQIVLTVLCVTASIFGQSATPGVVKLEWNAYPGTALYEVYRSTNAIFTNATLITTSSGSATNFYDDSAAFGETYNYWVVAKDGVGNSNEVARFEGSQSEKVWEYKHNGGIYGAPAIGPDGTIYIATSGSPTFGNFSAPGKIVALSTNGAVRWEYPGIGGFMSTPAVSATGNIYAINGDGHAYALTAAGELKWKRRIQRQTQTRLWRLSPAITGDDLIILPTTNGITALDEEGAVVWAHKVVCSDPISPVVGSDGTVYMSPGSLQLFAFSRMGRLKWAYPEQGLFGSSIAQPIVLPDDTALFTHPYFSAHLLMRFSSTGVTNGLIVSDLLSGTPVVNGIGTIFAPTRSRMGPTNQVFVTAFDGAKISNAVANLSYEPFTLSANNALYVSGVLPGNTVGPVLFTLFPSGAVRTNLYGRGNLGPTTFHPSALLLVGSSAGRLYALPSVEALPTNGWPTARLDLRQSGNLSGPSPAPTTPTEVSASVGEFVSQVQLSWADSDEFRYIEVWRSATTNYSDAVRIGTNAASSYVDRTPLDGTGYYFLRAINSAGSSEMSAPVPGRPNPDVKLRWVSQMDALSGVPSLLEDNIYVPLNNRSIVAKETDGSFNLSVTNSVYTAETPVVIGPDNRLHSWEGSSWVSFGTNGVGGDRMPLGAIGTGEISVALDGTVYVSRNELNAYSPGGALKWQGRSAADVGAAIDPDGTVYVAARNNFEPPLYVEAYSAGGSNLWTFTNTTPVESIVIRKQGILVGSGSLTALNFDGEVQWTTNIAVLREPIVGSDGTIFVASTGTNFYALTADGAVKWTYPTRSGGALVSEEGNVYINVIDGVLALSPNGEKLWSFVHGTTDSPSIGLALSEDGWLYFSLGTNFFALTTPDDPSEHSWSTERGNMQRTGQLRQPMAVDLLSFDVGPAGTNRVRIKSSVNAAVVIETSQDLVNWADASSNYVGGAEIFLEFPPELNPAFVRLRVTGPMEPPFEPLIDSFDDLVQDTEKWYKGTLSLFNGASLADPTVPVNEVMLDGDGKLQIQPIGGAMGIKYNGYVSQNFFNFTRKHLTVEIFESPNPLTTAEMLFSIGADGAHLYRFNIQGGLLRADTIVLGQPAYELLGSFNAEGHRHLRIRHDEAEDRIFWESSPNRVDWTVLHSRTRDFSIRNVRVELFGGTYEPYPAPGVAVFDDVELAAPTGPVN